MQSRLLPNCTTRPAELQWVPRGVWAALGGARLNTSCGYGRLYMVPHEPSAMCGRAELSSCPSPTFSTGIMRARFHPTEVQLYTADCAVWSTNCQTPGGFYRVRYTGKPAHLSTAIHARTGGLALAFSEPLDPNTDLTPR